MGFSTATVWEGFSEACADDAEGSWGCQVEAAEQRVGFFNQELRPISNDQLNQSLRQPSELSVRSATDAVRAPLPLQALRASKGAADKRSRIWTAAWQ